MPELAEPIVDASHAAFIQRGVGIAAAACARDKVPTLARATGCRISPDRRRVRVMVSAVQAAGVLKCVRDNGAIAVVFSEPSTHRTVQLKGKNATVEGASPEDIAAVAIYRDAFVQELAMLGYERALIRRLLMCPEAELVALVFTPTGAFSQSPGPNAGEPLKVHP